MIDLRVPVVQAPLAGGPSTPALAAAVSNAGGLGFVAGGYLSPDAFAEQLRTTRELTTVSFGANLFVLEEQPVNDDAIARYAQELAADAQRVGATLGEPRFDDDRLAEKVDLVVAARVAVVSTTFGCPPSELVDAVHRYGGEIWATVTSAEEARLAARRGVDALVLQGAEAGGHRGSWTDDDAPALTLHELLRDVHAGLPVVAAGGIGDASAAADALAHGAIAVQAGTAFLLCPEAGTNEPHRRTLATNRETAVTRAFTGRPARGIVNEFMRAHPDAPHAYPHVHHLTAPLRAVARAAGDAERINLWAGTNFHRALAVPAADVVAALRP